MSSRVSWAGAGRAAMIVVFSILPSIWKNGRLPSAAAAVSGDRRRGPGGQGGERPPHCRRCSAPLSPRGGGSLGQQFRELPRHVAEQRPDHHRGNQQDERVGEAAPGEVL